MVPVPLVDLLLQAHPLCEEGLNPGGEHLDQPAETSPECLLARARARQYFLDEEPVQPGVYTYRPDLDNVAQVRAAWTNSPRVRMRCSLTPRATSETSWPAALRRSAATVLSSRGMTENGS